VAPEPEVGCEIMLMLDLHEDLSCLVDSVPLALQYGLECRMWLGSASRETMSLESLDCEMSAVTRKWLRLRRLNESQ
jgi:hypothetical protein